MNSIFVLFGQNKSSITSKLVISIVLILCTSFYCVASSPDEEQIKKDLIGKEIMLPGSVEIVTVHDAKIFNVEKDKGSLEISVKVKTEVVNSLDKQRGNKNYIPLNFRCKVFYINHNGNWEMKNKIMLLGDY